MGGEDTSGFFKNSGKPMAIVGLVMILIATVLEGMLLKGMIDQRFSVVLGVFLTLSVVIVIAVFVLVIKERIKMADNKLIFLVIILCFILSITAIVFRFFSNDERISIKQTVINGTAIGAGGDVNINQTVTNGSAYGSGGDMIINEK